jgi:hypothetical protein
MRRAIPIALALSCMSVQAVDAYYEGGNQLYEYCQSARRDVPDHSNFFEGVCGGYVTGVHDALEAFGRVCVPQGTAKNQLIDFVVIYLRDHPEKRYLPGADLVADAFEEKFPCN